MKKNFWDRTAKIYDWFMRKDHKAYKLDTKRVLFSDVGGENYCFTFLKMRI